MSHVEYLRYGTRADQLVEECSELILAIQKSKRFGLFARDPLTGKDYNNQHQILEEIQDVLDAITRYRKELLQIKYNPALHSIPLAVRLRE